jgi:hypothetical protein
VETLRARAAERGHTDSPSSIRAVGTRAFIAARGGDLATAADGYRDAIRCAVDARVFPKGSIELADLEAALGSTCYTASDRCGGGADGGGSGTKGRPGGGGSVTNGGVGGGAEGTGDGAKPPSAVSSRAAQKLLQESLGCFRRAAGATRRLRGAQSARHQELARRVKEVEAVLEAELTSGSGVDPRRAL